MNLPRTTICVLLAIATSACADERSTPSEAIEVAQQFHNAKAEDVERISPQGGQKHGVLPQHIQHLLSKSLLNAYLGACKTGGAWDVRFNDDAPSNSGHIEKIGAASNTKFISNRVTANTINVRANYDHACSFKECGNYTDYTLTLEGGKWKIDDIAIGLKKDHMGDSSWRENYPSLKKKLRAELVDSKKASQ